MAPCINSTWPERALVRARYISWRHSTLGIDFPPLFSPLMENAVQMEMRFRYALGGVRTSSIRR